MLQAAQKQGAEFIYGKAEICHKDGVILGVKVNDESIPANKIIVTAGAWTQELLKPLGLDFQLTFQKGQIVHLQMEREDTSTWPVVMPPGNQNMLDFDHGEIIIGSTHEKDVGFNLHVTAGGIYEILDKAMDVAPGLAQAYIKEFRVGFRPYTPNFYRCLVKFHIFRVIYRKWLRCFRFDSRSIPWLSISKPCFRKTIRNRFTTL